MSSLRLRRRTAAIVALFVLSGAAGLVYEVVWARQLVLVFGNTTQAVSAILTGFFGGMAIGSVIGGRVADRIRSPLALYGVLELILVAVVVVTPATFTLIREAYRGIYPGLEASPAILTLVRFGLALIALGPATILMGATLPALTRELTRPPAHLSRAFGWLYAANTIGAILGTTAAGFALVELFGLSGALLVGAACSAIAGLLALLLARSRDRVPRAEVVPIADVATIVPAGRRSVRMALAVAFASGLVSLGYQVLWTRLLASGSGNSTYVFTMILAVFLTGIALGAIVFTFIRPRLRNPMAFLAATQIAVALLVIVGLVFVISKPSPVDPSLPLAALGILWNSVLWVVLPTTVILGLSFPASSALLPGERSGAETGQLLAANTTGAIAGSFVVPFFVVPALGSTASIVLLAAANLVVAGALLVAGGQLRRPSGAFLGAATAAAAVIVAVVATQPGLVVDPTVGRIAQLRGEIYAQAEDEIAAVQAGALGTQRHLWVTGTSMTVLTIDANLMPIIPLMLRPASTDVAVIAFGMGSTYRSALAAGLRADAVELVPSVPKMLQWFHADADAVRANPNGRIIVADGRNHLELTERRYDIIVTDPPPPIESSGASVISSYEYYLLGRSRLKPGGIMMQWLPYGPGAGDHNAHIRSFRRAFPHVTLVNGASGYGLFMLGSEAPIAFDDASIREVLARPGVLANLSEPGDTPAKTIDAWAAKLPTMVLEVDAEVDARVGDGPFVTDDRPYSEYFLLRRTLFAGR